MLLVGAAREATTWRAESYKDVVRSFMEAMGYSQTIDSFGDGTTEDMVFVPIGGLQLNEARVEAKDSALSLSDRSFKRELLHHLRLWLAAPTSQRFDFYIFARQLRGVDRWREVFETASETAIRDLLSDPKSIDSASKDLILARWSEVLGFFSRSFAIQGGRDELVRDVQSKLEISLGGPVRWPDHLRERMDRRLAVEPVRDTLVSNLIEVRFAGGLIQLGVRAKHAEDVWAQLGIERTPPYAMVENQQLLTFDEPGAISSLSSIRTGERRLVNPATLEPALAHCIVGLLHQYFGKLTLAKGAIVSDDLFYFRPQVGKLGLESFEVPGVKNRGVSLADPFYKSDLGPSGGPTLLEHTAPESLNFVRHIGFNFRVEKLWNAWYVAVGLHRVYTSDGRARLDRKAVERIDRHFREPRFNRAQGQLTKLQALVDYLLCQDSRWALPPPTWKDFLQFGHQNSSNEDSLENVARPLARTETLWSPVPDVRGEPMLEEYGDIEVNDPQ